MVLFDFATQQWTGVTDFPVGYHKWSRDGKYVLFNNCPHICRARMTDLKVEQLVTLRRAPNWFALVRVHARERRKSTPWMWTFRRCQVHLLPVKFKNRSSS